MVVTQRSCGAPCTAGRAAQSTLEDMDELANLPQPKNIADMNGDVVAKLHVVEKHIRKNKLQVPPPPPPPQLWLHTPWPPNICRHASWSCHCLLCGRWAFAGVVKMRCHSSVSKSALAQRFLTARRPPAAAGCKGCLQVTLAEQLLAAEHGHARPLENGFSKLD